MMNLFLKALTEGELAALIMGEEAYFVQDREYGGHWSLGAYNLYIKDFLSQNQNVFPDQFWAAVADILSVHEDANIFLDMLVALLIPYYHTDNAALTKERTVRTPAFFIEKLNQKLLFRKASLLADRRGTGVEWNSSNGLWGSICGNLKYIKDKGGPDFLIDLQD